MIDYDKENFKLLSDMKVLPPKKLFTKQDLYDAKLNPINFLSKIFEFFIRFLLELGADFYFTAAMRQVSNEAI